MDSGKTNSWKMLHEENWHLGVFITALRPTNMPEQMPHKSVQIKSTYPHFQIVYTQVVDTMEQGKSWNCLKIQKCCSWLVVQQRGQDPRFTVYLLQGFPSSVGSLSLYIFDLRIRKSYLITVGLRNEIECHVHPTPPPLLLWLDFLKAVV